MDSPSKSNLTVDGLQFPDFDDSQIDFFRLMIHLLEQDRLNLEPDKVPKKIFDLQWNCILAMESQFKWLIDFNTARKEAARKSRLTDSQVSAQEIYKTMQRPDVSLEDLVHII